MDNLVQAAIQLAEQPLQDAEEEVLFSSEIIESTPFARVGPGHYRIQRRCLDPSLQDFSVACFLESFATTIRQFRIGSAWAHQTPCGKKRLDGLFVSSATCQPYSAAL